jgi:hypothetical protein
MQPFTYPMSAFKEYQQSLHKNIDGTYVFVYALLMFSNSLRMI